MYRTVKGKRELTKWLKENGYKENSNGVWRKRGWVSVGEKMLSYCGKRIVVNENNDGVSGYWGEDMLKPVKKLNSLEQLQADHKELKEKYEELEKSYADMKTQRDDFEGGLDVAIGKNLTLAQDAVKGSCRILELENKIKDQNKAYDILTGRHDALKEIVERIIK